MGEDYTGPITVAPGDGPERELADYDIWSQSETIEEMVKETDPGDTIPLASVEMNALDKVVEYMEQMAKFKADGTSEEDKQAWIDSYKQAFEPQDQLSLLVDTMNAANFMNVRTLLDELCKFVAKMVAERTPKEILDYFNIKGSTPENEVELIATHNWIDPKYMLYSKEIVDAKIQEIERKNKEIRERKYPDDTADVIAKGAADAIAKGTTE